MSMDILASRRILLPVAALCLLVAACGGERKADIADDGTATADGASALRTLSPPAAAGSGEPNLAVGPDGRVYLSWIEPGADSTHALRFSVLEGDRWSAPRTVASGRDWFVNWADFPSLAVLPGNRLAAHWLQRSGGSKYAYDVRVAISPDGGVTWTESVVPHTDGTQTEHGFASLWPAGADSLGLVWLDGRKTGASADGEHNPASEMTLRYTTVGMDGRAAPDREVDGRVCDCCQTGMAMTSTGPLVVYRDRSPDEVRDIYVTRMVNGAWTEGRPVHADGWVMPACPVNGPQADADGQRVAVAWFTAADSTPAVKVAFSADGGVTFGAPARVDGGNPEGRVDVQLLADGGALVSWMERTDAQSAEVRIRRVGADGRMGEPRTLASASARSTGFPRMVRAGDGVVFAWTGPGKPSTLHAARLALADLR
ncbi:sialidase family protein [Longimicrobium sp.]|uniref:sialidase family protein n=1 Tax=Longimicrobium sp. TaxID=2029185 RepID=UPI002E35DBC7|nr:sialidase family protein [Longimicrobium sp.]HEX6036884.1 sialidase family protein [Longimicrobium sp.]